MTIIQFLMAKKSKLLEAFDSHFDQDYDSEKQRKLRKQATKREVGKPISIENVLGDVSVTRVDEVPQSSREPLGPHQDSSNIAEGEFTDDMEEQASNGWQRPAVMSKTDHRDRMYGVDENDAIALSDVESLAPSEKEDFIPYQRLTINNASALLAAQKAMALPSNLPFSAHQTYLTEQPMIVDDVNDDLSRELAFYKQCLSGAEAGRKLLKQEGVPFSRPKDYFAEMVKNDEHMGKIKNKILEDAGAKKASEDAKRQRQLRKFGKQVQVAKEQERAKAKKATLEKIDLLRRSRFCFSIASSAPGRRVLTFYLQSGRAKN